MLQSMGSQRVTHDLVTEQQCVVQQKLTNSHNKLIMSKQTHRKRDQRAGVVGRDDWMKVVTKVQTYSYKINTRDIVDNMINIINSALCYI